MSKYTRFLELAATLPLIGLVPIAVAGPQLDVYAYSVAAQSTCATSGPAPGSPGGITAITSPYAAGCPGQDLHTASAATGPVQVSSSAGVVNAISSFSPPWTESGSSQAIANYGVLGSEAGGTLSGATDGFSWRGHESFARFTETYRFINGVGNDTAHFLFTVDGKVTVDGRGQGQMVLASQASTQAFPTIELRIDVSNNFASSALYEGSYVNWSTGPIPAGLALLANGIDATGVQVQVDVPFTYGTDFDLSVLLFTAAIPSASTGNPNPSAVFADFFSTATLTGISVNGTADFAIESGSGTLYDRNGVRLGNNGAVPEPATLALLGLGLVIWSVPRSRRCRNFLQREGLPGTGARSGPGDARLSPDGTGSTGVVPNGPMKDDSRSKR